MPLTAYIISFITGQAAKRFEAVTQDPVRVQREKLLAIVQKNAETEYGQRYGFSTIHSVADYQQQVPVIDYEDIRADMHRTVDGEKKIFTAEDPVMFAQTSGTTGEPKYIPVTPTCQGREHKDQMRTWLFYAQRTHPDLFHGRVVSLVSPAVEGYTPSGLPYGSTSGHIYKNMLPIVRKVYSIPYEVFEITDYQAKYYAIMRIAMEHDVRFLATANPSSILKLCEKANAFSEDFIRDIRDGTLSQSVSVEDEIRSKIEQRLRPNSRRARFLEQCRNRRNGALLPGDFWPKLSLIGCWKSGTVGHYLEKFPALFDPDGQRPVPVRDWGYLSSEARGSIPLSDEGSQGVLTVATNFYEFVEADELMAHSEDSKAWTFLTADQVEQGKNYYIFVTTTGGLYRYDINDIVAVTGYYHATPQIVFLRKGRGMTNLTGEKVSVNQVIKCFQAASKATGAMPAHFKAEADGDRARYIFRVEFSTAEDEATQAGFLASLDNELKRANIEYKAKRDSGRLNAPLLHVMREGWYERTRREQAARGKRMFQAKTELLSPIKAPTGVVKPELETVVTLDK